MSGIFGIVRKDAAPVAVEALDGMRRALAHWGPDGHGTWRGGPCGMGHVLMIGTPEARHESQPRADPACPGLVIAADARLDNRPELLDALGVAPPNRAILSDDVVILRAFARWGERCVERFAGAFAFVVWDERERSLFCARDHLGARPFLYHDGPAHFVFATDVRAVLSVEGVPRHVDELAVAAMRQPAYHYLRTRSCFRGIVKLPPAGRMWVRRDRTDRDTYWFPERVPRLRLRSVSEYAEALGATLRMVVDAHLRTPHPVGSHLSGGLDSSTVTALAAQRLRGMGRTLRAAYSWSPPPGPEPRADGDERTRIEDLCLREGIVCRFVDLTTAGMVAYYRRDVTTEPCETLAHETFVLPRASSDGVRVMLSGWGGDEFISFHGTGYYADQFRRGHWRTLLVEARRRHPQSVPRAAGSVLREVGLTALPMRLWGLVGREAPPDIRAFLRSFPNARRQIRPDEWKLAREGWRLGRVRSSIRATMAGRLGIGHLEHRMVDWAQEGARHGVEYRYPLLDRRLVELALSLPPEMFRQGGWDRFLFRRVAEGIVSQDVSRNRSKAEPRKLGTQAEVILTALRQLLTAPDIPRDSPLGRFVRLRLDLWTHISAR